MPSNGRVYAEFDVASSSRFPFTHADRQTDKTTVAVAGGDKDTRICIMANKQSTMSYRSPAGL